MHLSQETGRKAP